MAKKNSGPKAPAAAPAVSEETKQAELQAASEQEAGAVQPPVNPKGEGEGEAPAGNEQAPEVNEAAPAADETSEEEPVADEPVQVLVSTSMALLQQELAEYVEAMRPGREVSANTGMLMQVKLNALVKSVLRQEGEEFVAQLNYLLAAFEEHREGVFGERYVFRFIDSVPLSRGDRTALERLVNLFIVTADAKSRKDALKHVDLAKVAETLQDGKMQERLFQFYSM